MFDFIKEVCEEALQPFDEYKDQFNSFYRYPLIGRNRGQTSYQGWKGFTLTLSFGTVQLEDFFQNGFCYAYYEPEEFEDISGFEALWALALHEVAHIFQTLEQNMSDTKEEMHGKIYQEWLNMLVAKWSFDKFQDKAQYYNNKI